MSAISSPIDATDRAVMGLNVFQGFQLQYPQIRPADISKPATRHGNGQRRALLFLEHPAFGMLTFRTLVGPIFDVRMVPERRCAHQNQRFGARGANRSNWSTGH
jgi:hypothetical protein